MKWNCAWVKAGVLVGAMVLLGFGPGLSVAEAQNNGKKVEPGKTLSAVEISGIRERAVSVLSDAALGSNALLRANAIEGISRIKSRAKPIIAAGLTDENLGVRTVAAIEVGRQQIKGLAASVKPLLNDQSPYVRAAAIFALVRCGEKVDQTPLASIILSDDSPRVRAHVGFILGELGNKSAMGLLRSAWAAPMPRADPSQVRLFHLQLAEAMIKLGDDDQLHTVRAALYPSRPDELEAVALAAQILGEVHDMRSTPELINRVRFVNEEGQQLPAEIRLAMAAALAKLGHREGWFVADEFLMSDLAVLRAQAAHVYGVTGFGMNLSKLDKLMGDEEGIVRVSAAAATLELLSGSSMAGVR